MVVYVVQLHGIESEGGVVCDRTQFPVYNTPHASVHMDVSLKLNLEGVRDAYRVRDGFGFWFGLGLVTGA